MKILFVQKRLLFPADTGAKIRTLNIVKYLAKWNDLTYACNFYPGEEQYVQEMERLGIKLVAVPSQLSSRYSAAFYAEAAANVLSPLPFTAVRNTDPPLRDAVVQLMQQNDYDLVICDTVVIAENVPKIGDAKRILFQHNVESQIFERHAAIASNPMLRHYMRKQKDKMSRYEKQVGDAYDGIIAVSEQDRKTFGRVYGWDHVDVIDTAVDTDYFRPHDPSERVPGRVVFVGSMDWMPNQDGIVYFVEKVWPAIARKRPDATFHIVGRNPPQSISKISGKSNITVWGRVPDVRPHLAQAEVVVVPLLVGGGTRIKIFEAFAMNCAVVSTTIGAEGLPVETEKHLLLRDEPVAFADAILKLLASNDARTRLGNEAGQLVNTRFGAESIARQFQQICEACVGHESAPKMCAV